MKTEKANEAKTVHEPERLVGDQKSVTAEDNEAKGREADEPEAKQEPDMSQQDVKQEAKRPDPEKKGLHLTPEEIDMIAA